MMRRNKIYLMLRRIVCLVLAFLLSLLIVGIVFLSMLRLSNNNSNTVNRVLASSDYYNNLYEEIVSNAKMLTISTGLPMEVLDGVFQAEEIQAELDSYIEAIFAGEKYAPNTQSVRERLEKKIDAYLAEKNIRVDTEITNNINDYISLVTDEYSGSMDLPIIEKLFRMNIDYIFIFGMVTGLSIMFALLILSLLDKRSPWYQQLLFYFYTSTFSAAIMLAVIPLILLSKQLYRGLQITPSSLYYFVIDYIKVNLQTLVYYSMLLSAISIILVLTKWVFGAKFIRYVIRLRR